MIMAGAAAGALALAACGSGGSSSSGSTGSTTGAGGLTTVSVSGLLPIEPVNPFLNAEATGAFGKQGIKLNLGETAAGVQGIPLLASGKVQVLVGGLNAGVYDALSSGIPFKYVGDISTTNGSLPSPAALDVTTRPVNGKPVTSVTGLKGQKIAINGGSGATGAYLLGALLARYGMTLAQVDIVNVPFPDMQKAVQSGAVTAAIAAPPFNVAMEKAGVSKALAAVPGGLPGISLFYSDSFASSPEAQKFFDALVAGSRNLAGAGKRSQANLEILAKATGFSLAQLSSLPFSDYPAADCPSASAFTEAENIYVNGGIIKLSSKVSASSTIDTSFCTAAQKK